MRKEVIGNATVYFGDFFEVMPTLQPVDMVLADLPYGTTQCAWDSPIDLTRLWPLYRDLCDGPVLLFAQTPFDKVLGASNLPMLKYEWIWEKTHPSGHLNAKRAPMKAHENILVFYDKQPTYNPIKTSGHVRKTAVKRQDLTEVYGAQDFNPLPYDSTDRYPRDVLVFPSDKQREAVHPTQKPVALCGYMVLTYTNEGDTVLDNCMGSGSAGVACLKTGRRFIGIENKEEHFDNACRRLTAALQQERLFA